MKKRVFDEAHVSVKQDSKKSETLRNSSKLRRFLSELFSTEKGICFVIILLSMILITGILSMRFIFSENNIRNGIATRDIVADEYIRVEDVEQTRVRRQEARQHVRPIYITQVGADKIIMDKTVQLLENVEYLREKQGSPLQEKRAAMAQMLAPNETVPNEIIDTILQDPNWKALYHETILTTERLIAKGVNSEDYRTRKRELIRAGLTPNSGLTPSEQEAVIYLVGLKIRPTLSIDERLTEEARNIAEASVEPVVEVFNKGDTIVEAGHQVTPLQSAALQKQGIFLEKNRWLSVTGVIILGVCLLSIIWRTLYLFEHGHYFKPSYVALIATVMTVSSGALVFFVESKLLNLPVMVLPFPIMALLITVFIHPRLSILITMMILLLCGLALQLPLDSLSVLVIASLVGIFVLSRKPVPNDRNDLIISGFGVGIAQGLSIVAVNFIYEPVLTMEKMNMIYWFLAGIISGLFSGVLTLGILPLVEGVFKLVTPYTLLELANHDRPMLRKMQMEAPGTFHHSVMVASLAEAAALEIGANPILTRVGSLYHDIGKTKRPLFFVENQSYFGVENPHDKLTPRLSKMVITAHPRDGVEMAKQLNLPEEITQFMTEHHGTLVAGYFYNQAVLQEGEENVNKSQFRYPGPKPQSKETSIVMLADACESAVRALKNPTLAQVEERVDKIIKQRVDDEQFTECPITFRDIKIIRDTFIRVLRGIQHNRIEYQQNILQELGKKSMAVENMRQASQKLKAVQQSDSGTHQPKHDLGLIPRESSSSEEG